MAHPPTARPRRIHPRSLLWTRWTYGDGDGDDGDDDADDCEHSTHSPRPSPDGPLRDRNSFKSLT